MLEYLLKPVKFHWKSQCKETASFVGEKKKVGKNEEERRTGGRGRSARKRKNERKKVMMEVGRGTGEAGGPRKEANKARLIHQAHFNHLCVTKTPGMI